MIFPHDHEGAAVLPSPNCGARPDGARVQILLIHYTGMESGDEAQAWLRNPESEVSAHYIVHENGLIVQLVPEAMRAWHAGASCWEGVGDVNSRSIGVEVVNRGHRENYPPYGDRQIDALIELTADIAARWSLKSRHVLAHSDVSAGRKVDPGPRFPWQKLADAGIGIMPEPRPAQSGGRFFSLGDAGAPVEALQAMLALYGYDLSVDGIYGERTATVVGSFQAHFRPNRIDRVADFDTIAALRNLLDRSVE